MGWMEQMTKYYGVRSLDVIRVLAGVFFLCCALSATAAWSAPASDQLLPATTRGYLSVPSVEELRQRWQQTQLGQLAADPVMKPFAEDLERQVRQRLLQENFHLELEWDDVIAMAGGELTLATIQPQEGAVRHASVMLLDVTGHKAEMERILNEGARQLEAKGAKRTSANVGDHELVTFTLPPKRGELEQDRVVRFVVNDLLVIGTHAEVVRDILVRLVNQTTAGGLHEVPAYQKVNQRIAREAGAGNPQVRWYLEPFGYAEAMRAAGGGQRKRGRDMLAILRSQGFDAVAGLGGWISLATGEEEMVHRTFVYAPGNPQAPSRFQMAARMLDFPNDTTWQWPSWVPQDLAKATQLNWKVKEAFEYSQSLVDAIAGSEGFFEDMLDGIASDPHGPQIDLREELVAHLGQEVTVVTDFVYPITPASERRVIAIKLVNEEAVSRAIQKVLEDDPDARRLDVDGQVIWEILDQDSGEGPDLGLRVDGIEPVVGPASGDDEGQEPPILRNSAITVAHGYLYIATHVDFLRRLLQPRTTEDQLANSEDLQLVRQHLERIGAGNDAARSFTRTDEAYRVTYELIRQGKMPESESLLGRLLNRWLGPEDEDVLREQKLEGGRLPDYEAVRRYLGPSGTYVHSEPDGWYFGSVLLDKHAFYPDQDSKAAESEARLPLQSAGGPNESTAE